MDLQPSQVSAFARFSDKLKSTTRRKLSTPSIAPEFIQSQQEAERRRSSVANYAAAAIRQIFVSSRPQTPEAISLIHNLPIELLTHVFLYLDFWSLLHCQLVCKRWRELIPGNSPLLAETLYLSPSHNLFVYTSVLAAFELEIFSHPYLASAMKLGFQWTGERHPWALAHRTKALVRMSSEIVFHPVILDWDRYVPELAAKFEKERAEKVGHGESKKAQIKQTDRSKESFEDMLVSMPPLQEIRLSPAWSTKKGGAVVLKAKEGKVGITLGDLFEGMEDWASKWYVRNYKPAIQI